MSSFPTFPVILRILEGRNLKGTTKGVAPGDCYCIVGFKKGLFDFSKKKADRLETRSLPCTVNPQWNEEFVLHPVKPETSVIVIKVYERERMNTDGHSKDKLVGKVKLPVAQFWQKGVIDSWYPLTTTLSKTGHGEIHCLIEYRSLEGQGSKSMYTGPSSLLNSGQGGSIPPSNTPLGASTGAGPVASSTSATTATSVSDPSNVGKAFTAANSNVPSTQSESVTV